MRSAGPPPRTKGCNTLDYVELCCDPPEHGLARGERGAVVHVLANADAYLVEFVDPADGSTRAEVELTPDQLRPILTAAP